VDEIGYITHAENLGYSHCWVTDSPMIRSNCWAVLALAAQQTTRMRLGTGHTGMRLLGRKPMRLGPFREYVEVVQKLLRGEEADYTLDGETHPIRFQMREHRFVDLDHRIPVYIAAYGPRTQALAGEIADGLVSGLPRGGKVPHMIDNVSRGAARG